VAVPCQDRSRRRRWPKASLYKGLSPGHARSPRATIECACGDKCSGAGKCPHPAGNSPEVNVRREMGKFKPVIFGQIHAAGDTGLMKSPKWSVIHESRRCHGFQRHIRRVASLGTRGRRGSAPEQDKRCSSHRAGGRTRRPRQRGRPDEASGGRNRAPSFVVARPSDLESRLGIRLHQIALAQGGGRDDSKGHHGNAGYPAPRHRNAA
jgi:hypothetical protein